ncbi:hypothetical protein QC762_0046410 [Podospora pseudocomata]|uniref:Uncharacterized protein n=1 Tax=Podospora pseudocomata TaxID=2093779 RepID=A0ABR0GP17_9PEZI|nr:hypothetical protein QC762_0046410 [Podospora pseudocomata]
MQDKCCYCHSWESLGKDWQIPLIHPIHKRPSIVLAISQYLHALNTTQPRRFELNINCIQHQLEIATGNGAISKQGR